MPNETRALASWASALRYSALDDQVIGKAKLVLMDWVGAALAGSREPSVDIVLKVIERLGAAGESSVISRGVKTSSMFAALANGLMGHAVQIDDIALIGTGSIHPAAPVIPTVLAVGEALGSGGKEMLTSIVAGYETEIRTAEAVMPDHTRFWHATSTCGTFGAVVSASLLLGLSPDQIELAIGLASTQAAGLTAAFGTMSQALHPGKAAFTGILSATLAKEGFTSPYGTMEDPKGFLSATSVKPDPSKLVSGLGDDFKIRDTAFKVHASLGSALGAVDGVLKLRGEVEPSRVDEIIVNTNAIAAQFLGRNYSPTTAPQAKFSLPFCVAVALLMGRLGPQEFSEKLLSDENVHNLMKKVRVNADENIPNDKMGAAEVILRANGLVFSSKSEVPKGFPPNSLSEDEVKEKFISLASAFHDQTRAREFVRRVDNIEEHTARDVMQLISVP